MHSFSAGDEDCISCTQAVECVPSTPAGPGPALDTVETPGTAPLHGPTSVPESAPRAGPLPSNPGVPETLPRSQAETMPASGASLAGAAPPPLQLRLPFPVLFATLGPGPGPPLVALVLGSHAPPHEPTHGLVFDPAQGRCLWTSPLSRGDGMPRGTPLSANSLLLVHASSPAARGAAAG